MIEIKSIYKENEFESISRKDFTEFLYKHLGEYGDPLDQIERCLSYAFSDNEAEGGFALAAMKNDQLVGALIMNRTGISGYIPENILVYIAVDATCRGEGIGKKIIGKALSIANGDVKLHVEHDNPAKRLYERIGFTSKYAEMRFNK